MIDRGGMVDNSQRWYGELGMVELVELASTVVDEGGLAAAWQGFARTKLSGTVRQIRHLTL